MSISTEDLRERLDSGTAAVFDVRGDVEFERGHLPGARTAPLGSLVFRVARIMNPEVLNPCTSTGWCKVLFNKLDSHTLSVAEYPR